MLPLFQEYNISHFRFKEHLRIAYIMALMAPACAVALFRSLGWWNPWLWSCCGVGLSLALVLHSVVLLLKRPKGMSHFSARLVDRQQRWFPYFFVIIQSSIASLIIMFVWFSITTLAMKVPLYLHITLVILALLVPIRRYVWAHISYTSPPVYEKWNEILHGVWHVLMSIFIARSIIALTISDVNDTSQENIAWQIMVWIPALIYMLFTSVMTVSHLVHGKVTTSSRKKTPNEREQEDEPLDRF